MISVKSFVIERAVDFTTILEEDFPGLTVLLTPFSRAAFPRFSIMISLIGYPRNFSAGFVYMSWQ